SIAAACTVGDLEIAPEMLQVRKDDRRKLLRADADTLARGTIQQSHFAFVHLDNGAGKFPDCQCLQQGGLARVIPSRKKGHPLRLEDELGRRLETFKIFDGDL